MIHGMCYTSTYKSWTMMKQRCLNINFPRFKEHGGRGITVCERWLKFENFLEDMGERPDGMSIDRIDNDGHYEPINCKWSTPKEQANNTKTTKLNDDEVQRLYDSGLTGTEIAKKFNVTHQSVYKRLNNLRRQNGTPELEN